jgi:hypothetical protein
MGKRVSRRPRVGPPLPGHQLLVDGAGLASATASTLTILTLRGWGLLDRPVEGLTLAGLGQSAVL